MRVIGYLQMRVVGAVIEGAGFVTQEQHLREWAQRHGHDVVRMVADRCSADGPGSGLVNAIAAIGAGEADALLVSSPGRLGPHDAPGVTVLFADRPDRSPAPAPPPKSPRSYGRSALGPWVGIAVGTALAAGVAAASSSVEQPRAGLEGTCLSAYHVTVPCDGREMATVVDVVPAPERCVVGEAEHELPDGTRLCLRYR